jgi:hypothetical protein
MILNVPSGITLIHFPGARDRLTDLSESGCSSDVNPEFFIVRNRMEELID